MKVTIYKAGDASKTPLITCNTDMPICKGDEFDWGGEAQIVRIARHYVVDGELTLSLWIAPKHARASVF